MLAPTRNDSPFPTHTPRVFIICPFTECLSCPALCSLLHWKIFQDVGCTVCCFLISLLLGIHLHMNSTPWTLVKGTNLSLLSDRKHSSKSSLFISLYKEKGFKKFSNIFEMGEVSVSFILKFSVYDLIYFSHQTSFSPILQKGNRLRNINSLPRILQTIIAF